MKQSILVLGLAVLAAMLAPAPAGAHCQVPCGIYDDAARVAHMYEDAATIEKGMRAMAELAGKNDPQSQNQLMRWVMTKEDHASDIMTTIAEYFLAQRVKPVAPDAADFAAYQRKLVEHHAVLVAAMKCKQNSDVQYVTQLRATLDAIAGYYPPAEHDH
jgi:nickel superoxide dismutase